MLGLSLCVAPNAVASDKPAANLSGLIDGIEMLTLLCYQWSE